MVQGGADGLLRLYLHRRKAYAPRGETVAVEEELRFEFPRIQRSLLGHFDLVEATPDGDLVRDWKSSANKPKRDDLLVPLDLQRIAMVRRWKASWLRPVPGWTWSHLVKAKTPGLVDYQLPMSERDRVPELERLSAVVQPTIGAMRYVLNAPRGPVPQASFPGNGCSFQAAYAASRR